MCRYRLCCVTPAHCPDRLWQGKASCLSGLGAALQALLVFEQTPCASCGAHSGLWLAHAKLALKQRDLFNPYDVGECGVQPTGGTEKVRCHLLKFAGKTRRGKKRRCLNISRETRGRTMGLKCCWNSQRRTWWPQILYIVERLSQINKTTV